MSATTGSFSYPYARPALTVDAAIVSKGPVTPKLLLIQRGQDPFAGAWALPGGFVNEMEPLDTAVTRELQEETSIDPSKIEILKQIGCFGDPGRDPRGWAVTVAYLALVPEEITATAADDAAEAEWFTIDSLPELAFDHKLVVKTAFEHLMMDERLKDDAATQAALRAAVAKLSSL